MTNQREYNAPYDGYEPGEVLMVGDDWSASGFAYLMSMFCVPGNSAQRWLEHNQRLRHARECFNRADRFYLAYSIKGGSQLQATGGWIEPGY